MAQGYLSLSAILFTIGTIGVLARRNVLVVLMSVELILNAANLAFVGFGRLRGGPEAAAIVLFVIVVAAIEAAVGLAIVVALFRGRGTTRLDEINLLRG
ncbi:MAG: NADH-quinone oxidoreductase subunit NuoK [Candidatus Riflebacteria bacterium]|nr:NADH-quinone oxidoreductase subunit NuoK [Candidatus Riflebacteria bacterium]